MRASGPGVGCERGGGSPGTREAVVMGDRGRGLEGSCRVMWLNMKSQPGALHFHCPGGRDFHLLVTGGL